MGRDPLPCYLPRMQPYRDVSGKSGILAYEVSTDSIRVRFRSGDVYEYSYESAGHRHVEAMKKLASEGRGLATYISQHADVRNGYVR